MFRIFAEPDRASDWSVQSGDDGRPNQYQDIRRHHEFSGIRIPGIKSQPGG